MDFSWDLVALALVCLFFAACFIQSGLDKVSDWKGNLEWLTGHFGATPLKRLVPLLLLKVTILELLSGAACLVSAILVFVIGPWPALPSLCLSALTLLMLFTGQRVAKDHAGAATLTGYFLVAIVGIMIAVYASQPHPASGLVAPDGTFGGFARP